MATRKVTRKKSTSASAPPKRVVADAEQSADQEVPDNFGPAKRVAKVVNLIVSIDDSDRKRSHEDMVADIRKKLGAVGPPYIGEDGKRIPGPHVTVTGGYYILDGKVCLPDDYDSKKATFKKGKTPPSWAGGPKPGNRVVNTQSEMERDRDTLSSDEYDKKYRIGKYAPKGETNAEHDARMRRQRAEWKAQKDRAEEEELEEFEWDENDVEDDEKLSAAAAESASAAVKKLKSTSKKRVVKKPSKPAQKKVVRRTKK